MGAPSWFLVALLALLAVRTVTLDRSDWPGFVGDEATYLMAAESVAWDGDFVYERADYDRFHRHWGDRPELLLFLQSPDHGRTLIYGKPFFYPIVAAPLTRLWPTHGALLTNLLVLALAAVLASRALRPVLGAEAPLWVATFVFGSVAFAYSIWVHSDSFLMSLVAIALSLAFLGHGAEPGRGRGEEDSERRSTVTAWWSGPTARWLVIGLLSAIVVFSRPFYLPLLLPLAALLPRRDRGRAALAFGLALVLVVGVAAGSRQSLADTPTSYTGERGGFYARVGLPEVDFAGETWDTAVAESGSVSWHEARRPLGQETRGGLWLWNAIYFVLGEHVGLVPYFLPLVLALLAAKLDRFRWSLVAAVLLSTAAFFLYRPFNFFGGGAAIGNRYFLPLYPLLWFVVARQTPPRIRRLAPVAVLAAAAPFLWPLWTGLGSYPLTNEQTYRFVSPAARALLPYETSQSHLKRGGQEDVIHKGIWVRVLSPGTRADAERIWVRAGEWAELLVAWPAPVTELEVLGPPGTAAELEVAAGEVLDRRAGDGVTVYRLRMPGARARHSMWWSWDPWSLYRLRLRFSSDGGSEITSFYLRELDAP